MIKKLAFQLKGKVYSILFPSRYSGPKVSKEAWEKQYRKNEWDYLENKSEKAHYDVIAEFFSRYVNKGELFDIGSGTGILYKYLKQNNVLGNTDYSGIDISQNAVNTARSIHPDGNFNVLNYETESYHKKFDCIVLNETLYYFDDCIKTLDKCIAENLKEDGKIIISIVAFGNNYKIWKLVDQAYKIIDERKVKNEEGISWVIKIIAPK
jgi:2-polyprenyl-3-methyl-5-hydroxy-6-metoxy-1,4-benzoquinol methylase